MKAIAAIAALPALLFAAPADFGSLEPAILEQLKSSNTPGATVAAVQGDKIIYSKAFGTANVETGEPMKPQMLFRIGSTTKMITAAAVLSLVAEGKIELDKPIGTYVKGLNPKLAEVTVHQLLSHSGGIADQSPMYGLHDDTALAATIRGFKEDVRFTEPGRIISYANPGYWVAGLVLEEVSGRNFAAAVEERVLRPAGMNVSTFRPLTAMTYPLAQQHELSRSGPAVARPFADNAASWPAGSLFSTAEEMARFMIAFMNDGKVDGKQVLSPKTVKLMSTPQMPIPGGTSAYTYGLVRSLDRGPVVLAHAGARVGYGSTLLMVPEQRVGVVVLGNRTGAMLSGIADKLLAELVPLKPDRSHEAKPEPLELPESELRKYTGTFATSTMKLVFSLEDGKLMVNYGGPKPLPVQRMGQGLFAGGPIGPFTMIPGPDGRIAYLHGSLRSLPKVAD